MSAAFEHEPDIYSAVEGLSKALTSTVSLLSTMVDQMQRGEEELRDAHLDLANAMNRRMDSIAERVTQIDNYVWHDVPGWVPWRP
jgi:hypothetical protein